MFLSDSGVMDDGRRDVSQNIFNISNLGGAQDDCWQSRLFAALLKPHG